MANFEYLDDNDDYESTHELTEIPHIWLNLQNGKYVFEDETNCFDSTEYDTKDEAYAALVEYCDLYL